MKPRDTLETRFFAQAGSPPIRWRISDGLTSYPDAVARMEAEAERIAAGEADELIWLVEHPPMYTAGTSARAEDLVEPDRFEVHATGRGGEYTYHGPGQLVVYPLLDLRRLSIGVRDLVRALERSLIDTLAHFQIVAFAKPDAPGVYVDRDGQTQKIASLGLRVSRGCSYHGISLNVAMDLEPFSRINPCGYAGLRMTQISDLGGPSDLDQIAEQLQARLLTQFGFG